VKSGFRESIGWAWKKRLVVEIEVDTRSGGLWQLKEAVKAIQEVVKDSKGSWGSWGFCR